MSVFTRVRYTFQHLLFKEEGLSNKMDMNCLFVGHIIYGQNNIYEEHLVDSLQKKVKSLKVISVNKCKNANENSRNNEIQILRFLNKPILDEIVRFFHFINIVFDWRKRHRKEKCVMIMLSAPIEVNLASAILQRLLGIKTVNLIIDTAMGNIVSKSLGARYVRFCHKWSERLCKKMSASMALNARVFPYLKLQKKPCLVTRIGHPYQEKDFTYLPAREGKKIITYTGTLIYYDGTRQLLEAMTYLNPDQYELHIYGKGPDEVLLTEYRNHSNIKSMGYISNVKMKEVMSSADLLINPRIDNDATDTFGFPSKMVEYLLSGTPVLTTKFAAIPEEYYDFVYLIEDQTGKGIADAIEGVFKETECDRKSKARKAYDYVFQNNSYEGIVDEMLSFFTCL